MSRSSGNTPWHATALRLHADGLSASKIVEQLKNLQEPPSHDAVKKFLARSKKDPGKALQTVAAASATPLVPPTLTDEDNRTLVQLIIAVERHRADTLALAFKTVKKILEADQTTKLTEQEIFQGKFALEAIKAARGPTGTIELPEGGFGDEPEEHGEKRVNPKKGEYLVVEIEGVEGNSGPSAS